MKELKMKDLVLEHYRKVYETEMDGLTVRVWKPRTMGKLPTYAMLCELKKRVEAAVHWDALERERKKVQWWLGNPDYGAWDAQLVRRFDPRRMTLDIYFAALLIRPFSRQAHEWYEAHSLTSDAVSRLMLMWDSREFDSNGGYDTSYGSYANQKELDKYLYSGKDAAPYECMTDPAFDVCFSASDEDASRRGVVFKVKNGDIYYNATVGADEQMTDNATDLMRDAAKVFCDFRKNYPNVTEMRFYTDEYLNVE